METWTIVDSYDDGDAHVLAFACGCEVAFTTTYTAMFPCSKRHADAMADRTADHKVAA